MLISMSSKLQKQYEFVYDHTMIARLHGIFLNQARIERYEIPVPLFSCNLTEGNLAYPQVIKMSGYIESMDALCFTLLDKLATYVISSLFVQAPSLSFQTFT
jgi:hypothetical protein